MHHVIFENKYKSIRYIWNTRNNIKIQLNKEKFEKYKKKFRIFVNEIETSSTTIFNVKSTSLQNLIYMRKSIVVIGFPYELGISCVSGCKFGPYSIRSNSIRLTDLDEKNVYDLGDIAGNVYQQNGREFDFLMNTIEYISCNNNIPIVLGGDHSISYPIIKGITEACNEICIIHFDAHQDFYGEEYINESSFDKYKWREELNHSNFYNYLVENDNIKLIYQIGIRNYITDYKHEKIKIYRVEEIVNNIKSFISNLNLNYKYYITFDVDCLSTNLLSSTGTPVPGGFEYREIKKIINELDKLNIIGLDIVELNNENSIDGLVVSDLIFNFIKVILKKGINNECK